MINTLADAFKLAHHSFSNQMKYECLLCNDEFEVSEINQITDIHKDTD